MILFHLFFLIYYVEAKFLFFERDIYEFFVSESSPIRTRIGFIQVTASSSITIQYELYGDTNQTFSLNPSTGELVLSNALDYETVSIYKLTIEARSPSSNISPSFCQLIIHVVNTNDNPPEINLIFYPSIVIESDELTYDRSSSSTPLATISIKDRDASTENITLTLNDTEHFQVQLIRQMKNAFLTEAIYILSTTNNSQLIDHRDYYLSLNACDNDQPILCTNRSLRFHLKSTEQFCNFSLNATNSIVDIRENLPNRTLIFHLQTHKYCPKKFYSIDDSKNFYIDSQTGDLYTSTKFNRQQQSIYHLHIRLNHQYQHELIVRILDEQGQKPFLTRKFLRIERDEFNTINLFNGSSCRAQPLIYHLFQLRSDCTLKKVNKPLQGKYLFYLQLNESIQHEDTFLLEILNSNLIEKYLMILLQSPWIFVLVISFVTLALLFLFLCLLLLLKKSYGNSSKGSSLASSSEESVHHKYDAVSTLSKLKVHDDQELSPSSTNAAIYLVQRPSPPLSTSSPGRDDEGYSGSSDVSDNHQMPVETTIIAANQLFEKYRIHEFRVRQSLSPIYSLPKTQRSSSSCVSPDVSLV